MGDVGVPFARFISFAYTQEARCRIETERSIFCVLFPCCLTQVFESAICAVPVYMVNLCGPLTSHIQPSKSMSLVGNAVNLDLQISMTASQTAGNVSGAHGLRGTDQPSPLTGVWLIVEKFAEAFRSERIPISHVATSDGRDVVRAETALKRCFGPLILGH